MSATIQNLRRLPFGSYVYYLLWQYTAANVAVRAHAKEKFDVVQHVSLGNCHFPSFMWKLGIPFIFGPVGGGEDTPKQLRRGLGLRGRIFDSLRRLFNSLLTHAPLVTATYVHATRIVVTTSETLREIPAHFRHKATVQQAVGIGPSGSHTPAGRRSAPPTMERPTELKLLYAGRLKPWKGLHLGLRALAALGPQGQNIHLTIVGAGSDESRPKRLAHRLALEQSLYWIPWIDREDLIRLYPKFDLFLFPSLHDSGGMAVLEAMSLGLPVLCLDLGGPGISVDSTCGFVIPARHHTEEELVRLMSGCLSRLLSNPAILEPLSAGARRRADCLSWITAVANTYGQTLARH
jgi:glycosyltransferase involved in cell wall biosynthesis